MSDPAAPATPLQRLTKSLLLTTGVLLIALAGTCSVAELQTQARGGSFLHVSPIEIALWASPAVLMAVGFFWAAGRGAASKASGSGARIFRRIFAVVFAVLALSVAALAAQLAWKLAFDLSPVRTVTEAVVQAACLLLALLFAPALFFAVRALWKD